jgi:hypothetical protein
VSRETTDIIDLVRFADAGVGIRCRQEIRINDCTESKTYDVPFTSNTCLYV